MGYRTVVMLNNDFCTEWSKDPELGEIPEVQGPMV